MATHTLLEPRQLNDIRRRVWDGEPLPPQLLPSHIASSWERSRDFGLSPWEKRCNESSPNVPLGTSDIQLATAVQTEFEHVWEVFGGHNWTLLCVNTEGVIVYTKHASGPSLLDSLDVGRRIQEVDIGTTAPICTLQENMPVTISGGLHYLQELEDFFCVSVPVYGTKGELLGALDITGIGDRNAPAVLKQLQIAAMATENNLVMGLRDYQIISLQYDPRLIATPLQGLLALDDQGNIKASNSIARKMLDINPSFFTNGECNWDYLFETDRTAIAANAPLLMRLNVDTSVYAQALSENSAIHKYNFQRPARIFSPAASFKLQENCALTEKYNLARKAFTAGLPILLLGETGTGKEVFARRLHDAFDPDAPFVAINCSAIPESLIESELFGYTDGSFTGGKRGGAKGRIEEAHGGTLLLDEIGDMPLSLQTRLLRVLQERKITRLGSSECKPIDIRIVSATHCDLAQKISDQTFREDLYYRLNGLQVHLPSLRERNDVVDIIDSLRHRYHGGKLHPDALDLLLDQEWPGNIRQLEQALRLAIVLAGEGGEIMLEHFPEYRSTNTPRNANALESVGLRTIKKRLDANNGNVKATAKQLGVSRATIYRKLKKFNVD